jgi:Tfp pilus assembly protein PilN
LIRINLLPVEIHAAEVRKQISVLGGAAGGLVVLALVGFWGTRVAKAKDLEKQLVQANEELRKYQAIVDKVTQLEQTRNQLQARRDVIRQLLRGRMVYPRFFEDFMQLLPAEVWITNLNTATDAQGGLTVDVTATSLSNFAIADWLTNLQSSPMCKNVVLGTIQTQEQAEGQAPLLAFTMRFKYHRPEA